MKEVRPCTLAGKTTRLRVLSVVSVLCLVGVAFLVAAASQIMGPPAPSVLAGSPDFEREIEGVWLSKAVKAVDTAYIEIRGKNLSSRDGLMDGDATFDARLLVTYPSGRVRTFHRDNVYLDYTRMFKGEVEDFDFEEAGVYGSQIGILTTLGKELGWPPAQRYDGYFGIYEVEPAEPEPEWDASVEEISLSRSVEAGGTADIRVRFRNRSSEWGSHSGWATFDTRLIVTSPSGKSYRYIWKDKEYAYDEEVTEKVEAFRFGEAGRWRFEAEIYDIRGFETSWGSANLFDRRTGSYDVAPGEVEWDAKLERISLSRAVKAGETADILVVVENQSERKGSHDGTGIFDLLLEWTSPSGRTYSKEWDDLEYAYGEEATEEAEGILFDEAGRWKFQARIYDLNGLQSGWDYHRRFDSKIWRYTVAPADDARVTDIRASDSGSAIEVDIENLSSADSPTGGSALFDVRVIATTPSGLSISFIEDNFELDYGETRTFQTNFTQAESGLFAVHVHIHNSKGMQQGWNAANLVHAKSETLKINLPDDFGDDLVDVCPKVTLEGGRDPWLLKVKVDGVERDLDSRDCFRLAGGNTGSGTFGEGEYLLEVTHQGYLPATLLVFLAEGDPALDPEVELLAGDINSDGLVGPQDLDLNGDGVITDIDATLLKGSGLADIDGDGDVLLGTDVLALAKNLGRAHSPTFITCQVLFSDETPESLDDPIDWSVGGCTEGDVEEVTTWLQSFSSGANTLNLVTCGIFTGNMITAIIPLTSASAAGLPWTGAACFVTGVAATSVAVAEFASRADGENVTKVIEGDPEALKEGGFILGVGALDFVGAGAFLKLGKGGWRVVGKLGVKSVKDGKSVSKTFSPEPLEAAARAKAVDKKLANALGSENEAAKLIKNVQGLTAAEQAGFFQTVSRASHLQDGRKFFGLDDFLRDVKDQSGTPLVNSLRELTVAVGLAQSKRSADEIVVLGSQELRMNFRTNANTAKVFAEDKQLDVIELRGDSAAVVRGASGSGLKTALRDGISIEDLLKVHEITRVRFDLSARAIDDNAIWQKLNQALTDADLKSKFDDMIGARTASNIPELNRVVFLDFVEGGKQRGIGWDVINLIISNAEDHIKSAEYIGADNVVIHFLGDATVKINNINVPKFVRHVLTITALTEGPAITLRQAWNAGVLSADEIGPYTPSEFPVELFHGEVTEGDLPSSGSGPRGGSSGTEGSSPAPAPDPTAGSTEGESPPARCSPTPLVIPALEVEGIWDVDCQSREAGRGYSKHFGFTVDEFAEVIIEVRSLEDPYVILRQGDATSGAALHFHGDMENRDTNSRIVATLEPGDYSIEVTTSSEDATGGFVLSVITGNGTGAAFATGCGLVALTIPASGVSGSWGEDCESAVREGRQARYYQLTLVESSHIKLQLESEEAETVLYLREGAGNTFGATTPGGFNEGDAEYSYRRASIEETLAAGTYTIEATTYAAGETGAFTLTVSGAGGTGGSRLIGCEVVVVTAKGGPVSGSWGEDCESAAREGRRARYFQFTLAERADINVLLESEEAETVLYLREGAGNTFGATTLGGFNDGDPNNYHRASVSEESLAPGTYTIEATTYAAGETGNFTLTVSGAGGSVGPGPIDCEAVEVTADGSPVSGSWGDECESSVREGRQARYYQFTLAESADIKVQLESDDAETVLYLREGVGNTSGATTPGGFNDGEAEYNYHRASVEESLAAGTYTIEATTYAAGETGTFTLTVSGGG